MPAASAPLAPSCDPMLRPERVSGWGGGRLAPVSAVYPDGIEALGEAIAGARDPVVGARGTGTGTNGRGIGADGRGTGAGRRGAGVSPGAIARGLGRSYGDAAQLTGGLVVATERLRQFTVDHRRGIVTAQAGVTVRELLAELVPAGWVVPVVPGTQHVTVGGAIASDIHGKNHGTAGTFGSHVRALGLLTSDGDVRELTPGEPDGLFEATVGGMGLTGVIVWAEIKMRAVTSAMLSVDTDRVTGLEEALVALTAPGGPHRVAWLDLLGSRPGRGVVTRAAELSTADNRDTHGVGNRAQATVPARLTVPARWPAGLLRESTVTAFNELRFRRAPHRERDAIESFGEHMFPLDALASWPRLYGRQGLVQYQLVVGPGHEHALEQVIMTLRARRVPCYLAVLKDFGPANQAPLSFPMQGWTLAMDLPRAAAGLEPGLRECDRLVAEAGGRVYLSKDARLSAEFVTAMYPRLAQWQATRDRADPAGLWRSDLSVRTGLVA